MAKIEDILIKRKELIDILRKYLNGDISENRYKVEIKLAYLEAKEMYLRIDDGAKRQAEGNTACSSHQKRRVKFCLSIEDGRECFYCGKHFNSLQSLTIDHIIPKSKIGNGIANVIFNNVLSCKKCNNLKGSNIHGLRKLKQKIQNLQK